MSVLLLWVAVDELGVLGVAVVLGLWPGECHFQFD